MMEASTCPRRPLCSPRRDAITRPGRNARERETRRSTARKEGRMLTKVLHAFFSAFFVLSGFFAADAPSESPAARYRNHVIADTSPMRLGMFPLDARSFFHGIPGRNNINLLPAFQYTTVFRRQTFGKSPLLPEPLSGMFRSLLPGWFHERSFIMYLL